MAAIEKNLDLFKQGCGEKSRANMILSRYLQSEDPIHEVLQGKQALIGILLGFARSNEILGLWKTHFTPPDEISREFSSLSFLDQTSIEWDLFQPKNKSSKDTSLISFPTLFEEKNAFNQKETIF